MLEFAEIAPANSLAAAIQRNQIFHNACRLNDINKVRTLLLCGADVNAVGERGTTPLSEALYRGHGELVELLLHNGAHLGVSFVTTK